MVLRHVTEDGLQVEKWESDKIYYISPTPLRRTDATRIKARWEKMYSGIATSRHVFKEKSEFECFQETLGAMCLPPARPERPSQRIGGGYDSLSEALGVMCLPAVTLGVDFLTFLWKLPDKYNELAFRMACRIGLAW